MDQREQIKKPSILLMEGLMQASCRDCNFLGNNQKTRLELKHERLGEGGTQTFVAIYYTNSRHIARVFSLKFD